MTVEFGDCDIETWPAPTLFNTGLAKILVESKKVMEPVMNGFITFSSDFLK